MRARTKSIITILAIIFSILGQIIFLNQPATAAGNWALHFNGASEPSNSVTKSRTGPVLSTNFTISADIRWDGTGSSYQGVVSRPNTDTSGSATTGYCLCLSNGSPTLAFSVSGSSSQRVLFSNTTLPVNRWATVKATYDGNYIRIYVDGTLTDTSSNFGSTLSVNPNGSALILGREFDVTNATFLKDRAFHGDLDNVEISSGLYPASTTTITKYTFSEGDGTTSYDSGSNSYTQALGSLNPPTWVQGSDPMTLTYDSGTGSTVSENHRPYDGFGTRDASTFSRSGYTFSNWRSSVGNTLYNANSSYIMPLTNFTLNAVWTPNSHQITYMPGDGVGSVTNFNANTDSVFTLKEFENIGFTYPGYHQVGWISSADSTVYSQGARLIMGLNNVTMTATWAPNTQHITYQLNGGTGIEPEDSTSETGARVELPDSEDFHRNGYSFGGWECDGHNYLTGEHMVVPSSTTLCVAKWIPTTHRVSYRLTNGTSGIAPLPSFVLTNTSITVDTGSNISRPFYSFAGWVDQDGNSVAGGSTFTVQTSDVVFTARWTPLPYTVTYSSVQTLTAGSLPLQQTVLADQNFTVASSTGLSVDGYVFTGWLDTQRMRTYVGGNSVVLDSGNLTLVAQWRAVPHTVSFSVGGFGVGRAPASGSYTVGASVTMPSAASITPPGYRFLGWNTNGNRSYLLAGSTYLMGTTDVIFIANFTANSQTINFSPGTGSGTIMAQVAHTNDRFTLPSSAGFIKNGYTFGGWSLDGANQPITFMPGNSYVVPAGSSTFTAKWIANTYNVKYYLTGGATGTPPDATVASTDSNYNLPLLSGFSRPGYDLTFWDDGTTQTAPGDSYHQPAGDSNFNTVWLAQHQVVTYDSAGATGSTPTQPNVDTDQTFTIASASGLTNQGYTFGGWAFEDSSYSEGDTFTALPESMTFTAQWIANLHSLQFASSGGALGPIPDEQVAPTGGAFQVPANPFARAGYEFTGWTDGESTYQPSQTISVLPATSSITILWPLWSPTNQSVDYEIGSVSGSTPASASLPTGTVLTVASNLATPPGFTFGGWEYSGNLYQPGDSLVVGPEDITLEATWNPIYLTVTYLIGGGAKGTAPTIDPIGYGSTLTLAGGEGLALNGKYFQGWSDGSNFYRSGEHISNLHNDLQLTAVWGDSSLANTGGDGMSLMLFLILGAGLLAIGTLITLGARKP